MFYKSAKLVETKVEESMDSWLSKRERELTRCQRASDLMGELETQMNIPSLKL